MTWLQFALAAPAIYALTNFIDKYLLERIIKDSRGMAVYTGFSGLLVGTVLWVVNGFPILSLRDSVLVLLTGVLSIWGFAAYYEALLQESTSKIIILFQMTPIFTLVLSMLVLKESITLTALLGFLLILFAAINMSSTDERGRFKFSKAFFLIMITDLFIAAAYIIFRFVVEGSSFVKIISYESWGIFLGAVLLYLIFPRVRRAAKTNNQRMSVLGVGAIVMNESIYLAAKLFTYSAISLGSAALVSVIEGTQVFYGILYGAILTIIAPKIFKEDISKDGILRTLFFAALAFVGIILLK
ncbi:hypothetical protein A2631_01020 [Candidatus Daviesbacteria bacterium RIFCSPHIGHO2_01_FULL_44_29]|uniref:EamA domain-containing protein n=1 Tax=Candidatus Daviesbacteria bacterium RIFCSPHIGHO2_02_FULL_43_12 TaxID=1797776 RepID=A0A1F5KHP1_9BACT|nr:MAG: hypothetical protein A2631_01020 [Candidatus Daviesbacteria bacterium RIFCSPHIGHO2_01_FULL_44_29]OGE40432.1 MAG: hypothetical protein A3D25_05400 [Candidatus Daviesbacteria bacterium RIFCSPHIGHO2_02_FULL_43_12]OGE40621.1 MAG: hypothetical protein A3E86_04115 [Candidatus Daviesbacteria bacterium RIFCSPHIGHO2_12_FULL_47_45]OGE69704.1 MAG: hypothetical protein A3B55_05915 [Candidatus Daviesbacteria bacterium RIFCSPLOWO2_01_FULL_43_15]